LDGNKNLDPWPADDMDSLDFAPAEGRSADGFVLESPNAHFIARFGLCTDFRLKITSQTTRNF
jgi:hypothetical protein